MKKLVLKTILLLLLIFPLKIKALEDGVYIIHSAIDDSYVLDVNKAISGNGINISLWKSHGGIGQKFVIKKNGDYYEIMSAINEKYVLDANGGIFKNSVNIQLWGRNQGNAQKWVIKEASDGYYNIISYNTNYYIDSCGGIAKNGTNIHLWSSNNALAQKFRFEKFTDIKKTIDGGVYTISLANNDDMVIDIYSGKFSNLTNIELYERNNGKAQLFYIDYIDNGYYVIKSYYDTNYVLDVEGSKRNNETNVELYNYGKSNNQYWVLKETTDGYYNIISKCNYLALDVYGGKASSGTNIQTYELHNSPGQKFKFNEVDKYQFKDLDNGFYFINTIKDSKKVLDINSGIMEENRNIAIYDLQYNLNQKWYIEYLDDGYYKILSNKDSNYSLQQNNDNIDIGIYKEADNQKWEIIKCSGGYYLKSKIGEYITLDSGNTSNNINIETSDFLGEKKQKFNFIKTANGVSQKVLPDGIYRISSALDNSMLLDVDGSNKNNGTKIKLWKTHGGTNQKFKITYLNNGYYSIKTLLDLEKVLDVEKSSISNGANVSIYSNNNTINQQWIIKDAGDGYYNIISNCGGNYLDVAGSSTQNGTKVLLWESTGNKNQKFRFINSSKDTIVIDVSSHQGKIDWDKVNKSGIYGVILRIGSWTNEDRRFSEYLSEVKRLGIPYGIYLFSCASSDNGINKEIEFAKSMISKYDIKPTLGIFYDIEDWYTSPTDSSDLLSKDRYDVIIRSFIDSISSFVNYNYKVKVYANLYYANNKFNEYARSQIDWIAQYNKTCSYKGDYSLWQYTDSGTVNGINGYVDMNYLY